jgi:hypothetical protein
MKFRALVIGACAAALAACSPSPSDTGDAARVNTPVRSSDFAVVPCAGRKLPGACVIVLAGGKRVVFGAPAGVSLDMTGHALRNTDAVMLLSLRGEDVEGLDEMRNAAWRAGRETSLPVAGPSGTGEFLGLINRAYEVSDALIYVEDHPAGGFDAALLALLPGDGEQEATVFDTGDLRISKVETGTDRALYIVDYVGHSALIAGCGADLPETASSEVDLVLSCESDWPEDGPVFVFQDGLVN